VYDRDCGSLVQTVAAVEARKLDFVEFLQAVAAHAVAKTVSIYPAANGHITNLLRPKSAAHTNAASGDAG
jgi:hypothetical protein